VSSRKGEAYNRVTRYHLSVASGVSLANDRGVFPYVPDALKTLSSCETAAGEPLTMYLVSDSMPMPKSSHYELALS